MRIHHLIVCSVFTIVMTNIKFWFRTLDKGNSTAPAKYTEPSNRISSIVYTRPPKNWSQCNLFAFDIIRNGTVLDAGEVLKHNGQIADISGGDPKKSKVSKVSNISYKEEPLGVLLHNKDAAYYQALIQFGARFQYTLENCRNQAVLWIVRDSPIQKKILALLNDPPILNITIHKPSAPKSSKLVLIPPAPYRADDLIAFRKSLMRRVLQSASLQLTDSDSQGNVTIFVRRVRRRALKNEADVLDVFAQAFPGEIIPSHNFFDMPFKEIISRFQSARYVLGGHGSGLANIIFCRPGAAVFEIRRPGTPSEFASELARLFRLRLHRYVDPSLLNYRPFLDYHSYAVNISAWRAFVRRAAGLPDDNRFPIGGKAIRRAAAGEAGKAAPRAAAAAAGGAGGAAIPPGRPLFFLAAGWASRPAGAAPMTHPEPVAGPKAPPVNQGAVAVGKAGVWARPWALKAGEPGPGDDARRAAAAAQQPPVAAQRASRPDKATLTPKPERGADGARRGTAPEGAAAGVGRGGSLGDAAPPTAASEPAGGPAGRQRPRPSAVGKAARAAGRAAPARRTPDKRGGASPRNSSAAATAAASAAGGGKSAVPGNNKTAAAGAGKSADTGGGKRRVRVVRRPRRPVTAPAAEVGNSSSKGGGAGSGKGK